MAPADYRFPKTVRTGERRLALVQFSAAGVPEPWVGFELLIRPHDATVDPEREWREFMSSQSFGHLIVPGAHRDLPVVVPTPFAFDGHDALFLHLSKANPVWAALFENPRCLFVTTAAVTYVPTSWEAEPGTDPKWGIPTSHYASVHAGCTAQLLDDDLEIRRVLAAQLALMQPAEEYGDPLDADAPYVGQLRKIQGLVLHIDEVVAKFKFDGGESDAVRAQVAEGYRNRDGDGDAEALKHLLRRHPPAEADLDG